MEQLEEKTIHHPWKVRLFIALLMSFLALIGLVLTDIFKDGAWNYWRLMAPCYGLLSLALSHYHRRIGLKKEAVTIWHEILHWSSLILAIYLVSYFVNIGLMGRYIASLQVLTLLAMATFLAGIYIESTFCLVGILLGIIGVSVAFIDQYIYTIMLPLIVIALAVMVWMVIKKKKHPQ